jgi:hypothetical protein
MTTEELEKLGIVSTFSTSKPRQYFIQCVGDVIIPVYYKLEDIFEMIYKKGFEDSIEKGKYEKIKEIKNILNIEYEDTF